MEQIHRTSRGRLRVLAPVLGGLALLGLGTLAIAAPPPGPHGKAGPCARLKCTDNQKTDLAALFKELREDTKADRQAIRGLRKDLATEWAKDSPDEDALIRIEGQIRQHHEAMATMVHDAMMEVHALLDPAQRQQLAQMLEHGGFQRLLHGGPGKHGKHGKRGEQKQAPQK